jgi:hypothetical protein
MAKIIINRGTEKREKTERSIQKKREQSVTLLVRWGRFPQHARHVSTR